MLSQEDEPSRPWMARTRIKQLYVRSITLRSLSKLVPIAILLLLWELVSGSAVPAAILPPFSETVPHIVAIGTSGDFHANLFDTMFRGMIGVIVATVIAVPLGMAMGRSDRVARNLNPIISLSYPLPKSPLIPLVVFWLGMGHLSRIMLAVIGGLLPILVSAYNGAENVQKELLWVSQSLGLNSVEETYKVMIPAALPTVLTGVRIGMIFSFIIVISSEMIMANSGLGVMVVQFGQYGQYAKVFATVVWITVLVAGLDRLYLLASAYLLRWSDQEVSGL